VQRQVSLSSSGDRAGADRPGGKTGRIAANPEEEAVHRGPVRRAPSWLRRSAILAVAVTVVLAVLWLVQRRLVFLPDTSPVPPASAVIEGARDLVFTTSDELELGAWYVPAEGDAMATVLVANGNAGNRMNRAPLAEALAARGFDVVLFDYRGYGGTPGSPSEDGLARDARAAREYVVRELDVADDELIYFGESIGSGVVSRLATQHPPAGLLLRSPFTDLPAAARAQLPFLPTGLLMKDRFPVEVDVVGLDLPVTVVLGTGDSVVPADQSRAVAAAAGAELIEVEGADHNDRVLLDGDELVDAVVALAERAAAAG